MDQLHTMRVFVAVAEQDSFAGAARILRLSRPAVTRAVAALEDQLGVELLTRTTRSVSLTQAGERYLDDCRRILDLVTEADAAAAGSHTQATGLLTLTAPVMFGRLHVTPIVTRFLQSHPQVRVRTLLLDRVVGLVDEGIDVGVRIGHLDDSAQMAIRVGEVRLLVVAAPQYLKAHGRPTRPEQLQHHTLVVQTGFADRFSWTFGGPSKVRLDVTPKLTINDAQAVLATVEEGVGMTRLVSYQVEAALASGRLVRVLRKYEPPPLPVHLVYPRSRHLPARTRAFLDFATDALRTRAARDWALAGPPTGGASRRKSNATKGVAKSQAKKTNSAKKRTPSVSSKRRTRK